MANTSYWLPEDLTGLAVSNLVEFENHQITSLSAGNNKIIITPNQGAFYNNEKLKVRIIRSNSSQELVRDSDFRVIGLDFGRTKASSSEGGVYNFILITVSGNNPIIANNDIVQIDYQAFGGCLTVAAYTSIIHRLNHLESISSVNTFNPSDINEIANKLEAIWNRWNYNPAEAYEFVMVDGTTGWKTIAVSSDSIDTTINFNNALTLKGVGKFAIQSDRLSMSFEIAYDIPVNPTNESECSLKVNVLNQQISELNVDNEIKNEVFFNCIALIPKFRLLVSKTDSKKLYLQMALISNKSDSPSRITAYIDNESRYLASQISPTYTINNGWELCSGMSGLPGDDTTNYIKSNETLGLQDYYRVWEGNMNLSMIQYSSWEPISPNLEYNVQNNLILRRKQVGCLLYPLSVLRRIDARSIKSFRIDVYDRLEQKLITVSNSTGSTFENGITSSYIARGSVNYFDMDDCVIEVAFVTNGPSIRVYAISGKSSYVNQRFDLRAIYIR